MAFLQSNYGKDKIYVLTAGEKGCFVLSDDISIYQPSFATEAVDRIGAGDAFVAGFLYGYLGEKKPERSRPVGQCYGFFKNERGRRYAHF